MRRTHKRRGARVKTRFKTLYSGEGRSGEALLAEISYSGARLETAEEPPAKGARVSVYVWLPRQSEPFELVGHVVRRLENGFAIEYERPGQDICNLVDAAAAAVAGDAPPEPPAEQEQRDLPDPPDLRTLDLAAYSLAELAEHAERLHHAISLKRGRA